MISRCGLPALHSGGCRWHNICIRRFSATSSTGVVAQVTVGGSLRSAGSSLPPLLRGVWSSAGASPRDLADLEVKVLAALKSSAIDPVLKKDVVSLGWVRGIAFPHSTEPEQPVRVSVRLSTMLHPSIGDVRGQIQDIVQQEIHSYAREKGWVAGTESGGIEVDVSVVPAKPVPLAQTAAEHAEIIKKLGPGLANVGQFLAVYSCKGGVGKSTVATNLAYELLRLGARVGLLDVDIYGPSLPVLVKPDDPAVRRSAKGSGMVHPIDHRGVKLMSLGYVSPNSGVPGSGPAGGPAVMRGPMAGRVVAQLLKGTDWGELDVLVLDLPPGTGDVQLEVCQSLQLTGAVCVTTPSKLAVADAVKGVEMFAALGVPTLATVQNMSYFDCEGGSRHYPFGKGIIDENDGSAPLEAVGIDSSSVVQLPISPLMNCANDTGVPMCLERPVSGAAELQAFEGLAKVVSQEMLLLQHVSSRMRSNRNGAISGSSNAVVTFDSGAGQEFDVASLHMSVDTSYGESFAVRLFSDTGAWQGKVDGVTLRSIDPKTGERMADEMDEGPKPKAGCSNSSAKGGIDSIVIHRHTNGEKKPRFFPAKVEKKGIYGYAVEWADGATIIYSMLTIAKAAGGRPVDEDKWSVEEK